MMDSVLITGGNGFIGRSLIDHLIRETDFNIVSMQRRQIDCPTVEKDRVKIVYHDLANPFSKKLCDEIGEVEYIIHLAGKSTFEKGSPSNFMIDNVTGTMNLMEYSMKKKKIEKILYLSTAEVFGPSNPEHVFTEDDIKNPSSAYATTKVIAEDICRLYSSGCGVPALTAYAMNTFGPLQSPDKYIPLLIDKVGKGEEVHICLDRNNSAPNRRNYLYIEDLCSAILFLLQNGHAGERYNIASERETDNLELARLVSSILDKSLLYKLIERTPESPCLPKLSGKKLFSMGWRQKTTLEEGLKKMISHGIGEK